MQSCKEQEIVVKQGEREHSLDRLEAGKDRMSNKVVDIKLKYILRLPIQCTP